MRQFIPVGVILLVCAAPAVGQVTCADWGSEGFFHEATAEQVTRCIGAGVALNAPDALGTTWLHVAARSTRDSAVIAVLVNAGVNVNARDRSGGTPLHEAASRKNLSAVRALLEAGAEVNARTAEDDTPLHRVMATRNSPGTLLTIPHDAPPQLRNADGPDDLAAFDLDTAIAAALVRAGANLEARNHSGETPLGSAGRKGHARLVPKLLELGAAPEPGVAAPPLSGIPVCDWADHDLFAVAPVVSLEGCLEAGARVNVRIFGGRTPLQVLVNHIRWSRDLAPAAIAAMLKAGADVNAGTGSGWTALHGAVGDRWTHVPEDPVPSADAVAALLAGGAEVNALDRTGGTPLHMAAGARSDNTEAVTVLLEAGADVNRRDESGSTPLHAASGRFGRPGLVRLLIDAGADVNARDGGGGTPLHRALREGSPSVAAVLLESGADPTLVDDSGTVADPVSCHRWPGPVFFHHATAEAVAHCIETGAEVNAEAQFDRVRNGSSRMESFGAGSTPLHVAAGWTRDPGVIAVLVGAGADANARNRDDYSPLHYAARDNSDPAVINALVAAGAEVNAWATGPKGWWNESSRDVTPLHQAARNGNPAIAAALLDAGALVNAVWAGGRMPLHNAAAENANPAVVVELTARGAEVNGRLPGGRTPLHEAAAKNGTPAVLAALLDAGAEVNAWGAADKVWSNMAGSVTRGISGATPWGGAVELSGDTGTRTPLHEAVMGRGDSAVVATLIAAGADVGARADLSRMFHPDATPLYWAVSANPHPAVPGILVQAGAGVNARGGSGWTPLHLAALRNPILFPILLELGADPEALDRYGKTPWDYAVDNLWLQGWEVVRRLREERGNEPAVRG